MSKTRVAMIIETLRDHPGKRFTAHELAEAFLQRYPAEMAEKKTNPRYATQEQLLAQLAAEIGGERTVEAKKRCPNIVTQDKPRPRLYWWDANPQQQAEVLQTLDEAVSTDVDVPLIPQSLSEHELYPLLIEFLHKEHQLSCPPFFVFQGSMVSIET